MRFEVQKKFFWVLGILRASCYFFIFLWNLDLVLLQDTWRCGGILLLPFSSEEDTYMEIISGKKDVSRAHQWCMGHADMGGHWSIARTTQFYMLKLYSYIRNEFHEDRCNYNVKFLFPVVKTFSIYNGKCLFCYEILNFLDSIKL